ncbi:MAG: MoaD/ThiS family protein, partial [Dehalococcoidia bacterium]
VFIPTLLRKFADGAGTADVPGATLREVVDNLEAQHPGLKAHLVDPDDPEGLMPGLAAVIDGEATILGLRQRLAEDSEVHFIPAVGGGAV